MPYNTNTATKVRDYLRNIPEILIEEKKMFGGLAFMVNGKMCINISGDKLMCRYDPDRREEVSRQTGYEKVLMNGREYKGFCYVHPEGFEQDDDFIYWINLCLEYNERARSSKK